MSTKRDFGFVFEFKDDQGDDQAQGFKQSKMITVSSTVITVTRPEGVTNLLHHKNSRPENLSGSEKKIGVFFLKTIFLFPSGFILRMIRPLNLEELDCLVASFAFD